MKYNFVNAFYSISKIILKYILTVHSHCILLSCGYFFSKQATSIGPLFFYKFIFITFNLLKETFFSVNCKLMVYTLFTQYTRLVIFGIFCH